MKTLYLQLVDTFRQWGGHSSAMAMALADEAANGLNPYSDIHNERVRAHDKHKAGGGSMEDRHPLDPAWLPVLTEEVGEVARAICERNLGSTDDDECLVDLREELVQVAAMAAAWIDAIDGGAA